jgi:heme o synthase
LQKLSARSFLHLIRYKVSLAVTFSGFASSVAFLHGFSFSQIFPVCGILMLACGASALNQYQERAYDAKMDRTQHRPLPSGLISPKMALILSFILLTGGLLLFLTDHDWIPLLLGLFNIIWYNGIYTSLKRKTAFAVVPGALTGAIPVFMGWTSAGGSLFDPLPVFLGFFIFMWQVPHFWLLGMMYEKDYKNAGFPTLSGLFSISQMKKIIFSWLLAASLSSFLLILFDMMNISFNPGLILLLNAVLLFLSAYCLFVSRVCHYRLLFLLVNIFMLLVFFIIIADKISANL